jgi:hypothetical protein
VANLHVANNRIFLEHAGRFWWTTDAVTWNEVALPGGQSFPALGYINGVYVAMTSAGIHTSTDLTTWAQRQVAVPTGLTGGGFSTSTYIAAASGTFNAVFRLISPSPTGLFAE